ncbi:MAG: metal ABC transporter permease [Chloroflexi bacterium]|uniref:metal ABC transporter permease n=1 Tax=Candidatus Flexifilum breve TaxID=3140694 RepID=UPI003137688E|nr:metal ABC transporter permease [Chloroflexota bacterium]MBK9746937.1 metal ABC transporter permease [Chloroflexota bacterium]
MDVVQQLLIDPLTLPFMQRAMLAVILIGVVSGVMGAFVVTRGMAFLGDALAHTILPGVAIGYLASNGDPGWVLIGGLGAGVISALGIGWLTRGGKLSEDTAIGVIFAGALALGIALISTANNYTADLTHILIGNVLAVGNDDLVLIAGIGLIVIVTVILLYKEFLIISFDPTLSHTLRLPGEPLRIALLVLLALTVVISLRAVGVAMVAAMLVTPAAAARFWVKRMWQMMIVAALIGAVGGVVGMYLAWHINGIAPSATIVLTLTAIFILSYVGKTVLSRR